MILALLRHLLEATVVTGIAALVVTAFARAGAAPRYTAWLVAMLKFAVPTAIFADLGARLAALLPVARFSLPGCRICLRSGARERRPPCGHRRSMSSSKPCSPFSGSQAQ